MYTAIRMHNSLSGYNIYMYIVSNDYIGPLLSDIGVFIYYFLQYSNRLSIYYSLSMADGTSTGILYHCVYVQTAEIHIH